MKITYRPEIDGLRAIAVGAVILYHAQITIFGYQPFRGGFIGVDIFFVISGYLITSIILNELVTTGSFSFKHFYERRIRRILPALLFVMLASLPFAWMYLLPNSFIDFSKSILYSLGFSSNFYFHYSGQQYGAESGLLKPFLHTWSLSVEEQYYILFPIVLLITFKYFRKYLIHILILGFVISLGLAEWGSRNHPSFNFYVLPTRGWELLAGSILAYFEITRGKRNENKILNLILPGVGLLLIGHSILFFNDEMFHPSFYTLSPIIGVCLIIWFSNKNEIITKILSTKLFVGIGLISYSLYLWHYPIFAFARITDFTQGSSLNKLLLGIIIVILSIFSYYFVERPARNKNNKFKVILSLNIFFIILLIIINLNILFNQGYKSRIDINIQEGVTYNYLTQDRKNCFGNIEICKFNKDKEKKIFLIGDSHFGSISYDLKSRIQNFQFIPITMAGYFYFEEDKIVSVDRYTRKINFGFEKFNKIVKDELSKSENNIIILGGSTSLYFYKKRYINRPVSWRPEFVSKDELKFNSKLLEDVFFSQLKKITKKNYVILLYPIPEIGNNIFKNVRNLKSFKYTYDDYLSINKEMIEYFDNIKLDNLIKVKPTDVLCDEKNNLCPVIDYKNNSLIFSDPWHPSLKGAEMINDLIMKEIEKIELKSN
ncbi:acyltransferase family protein [Candidatus Pelagibacter sp.]|nr:acyltransferase family protein [Candidatus Pelagibacter sp.]